MSGKIRKTIVAAVAMLLVFSMTVPVFAAGKPQKITDYRCWATDDPRWSEVELGNSGLTVGDAGCAILAYTKLLIQAGVRDAAFTPDRLVAWMKENGQFCTTKGKRAQVDSWKNMAQISPDLDYVEINDTPSAKEIMGYVGSGYYVILKVTLNGGGDHFVVVANKASSEKNKPLIWNCVRGVSANKSLWESYNLNKDPFDKFRSVDKAIVYRAGTTETAKPSQPSEPAKPAEPATPEEAKMELKNRILPSGTIAKGSAFTVSGVISSDSSISSVVFTVKDADSTVAFRGEAHPDSRNYSLYDMDSVLSFSKLAAGSYTWNITAVDETKCGSWDGSFSVRNSDVKGSGCTYPKGTLTKGQAFSCKGTVSSSAKIAKVTMSVYTTDGVRQFEAAASPNAKSCDLHTLDAKMTFRKLGSGKYIYRVTVTDANGVSKNVITTSFTVK
ncbi:MAG: hypothetical protein IJL72_02890 [Lachnospiraceae bacterium]|nr:hypothetical protein [Lachnospiraceae bacterium]